MLYISNIILGAIFFSEDFSSGIDKWTHSHWKGDESASFTTGIGEFYGDERESMALKTNESGRFYTITRNFKPFTNRKDSLHVQYSVKNEQNIDCGGGYLKLYPPIFNLSAVEGGIDETQYNIMFGPDICGENKKVHMILNYNNTNYENKKSIACPSDVYTHLYRFAIHAGGEYSVDIDGESKISGSILEDWPFLKPREIDDPVAKKPEDWSEQENMDDPNDLKPKGWDDISKEIPDPNAVVPEDWNTEDDGEWEPPLISNPEYKGVWSPQRIPDPNYKGKWFPPQIANPDYVYADDMGNFTFGAIGFELWQVKAGTAFDSIIVTNDVEDVFEAGNRTLALMAKEKAMHEDQKKSFAEVEKTKEESDVTNFEENALSDLKDEM